MVTTVVTLVARVNGQSAQQSGWSGRVTQWPGDLGCWLPALAELWRLLWALCSAQGRWGLVGFVHWGMGEEELTGGAITPTMRTTCRAGHSSSPGWSVGRGSHSPLLPSPFPVGLREAEVSAGLHVHSVLPGELKAGGQGRGWFLLPRPWSPKDPNPYWLLSTEPPHPVKVCRLQRGLPRQGPLGGSLAWGPGQWQAAQAFLAGASG